jgi:hypothetical protein
MLPKELATTHAKAASGGAPAPSIRFIQDHLLMQMVTAWVT